MPCPELRYTIATAHQDFAHTGGVVDDARDRIHRGESPESVIADECDEITLFARNVRRSHCAACAQAWADEMIALFTSKLLTR